MTIDILTHEEAKGWGWTHVATITYADLAALANGNTANFKLSVNKAGNIFGNVAVSVPTAFVFSDASVTSSAITVGDSGSATTDLSSTETISGSAVIAKTGTTKDAATADLQKNVYFTSTSGHYLNTATAGVLQIFWTERSMLGFQKV